MRSRLSAGKQSLRYFLSKPDWRAAISEETPFGSPADEFFRTALADCTTYLEFGAGSSTLVASSLAAHLVSVESDPDFLGAVQSLCADRGSRMDFIHADIGLTGPWGAPFRKSRVWRQVRRWATYPLAPWNRLGSDFRADLVLVDGRFRVASALAVVARQADSQWTMLVDDYVGRPEYSILEEFATLQQYQGRMAVFGPMAGLDLRLAERTLRDYVQDWR